MDNKVKILILYHSGAGSTRILAEIFHEKLEGYNVDIEPIKLNYNYNNLETYDFVIFGFPTYHCEASTSAQDFVRGMHVLSRQIRAFVFTTCGLYSGNTLRNFIKECYKKNLVVSGSSAYRSPASDGTLLFPSFRFMFNFEKDISSNLKRDIDKINKIILSKSYEVNIPPFKLYSILNYPNKVLGKAYKHNLKVVTDKCISCSKCVDSCLRECWTNHKEKLKFNQSNCEFCFKCIHHCPSNAIIISNKTLNKPKLDNKFLGILKEKILKDM